MSRMKLTKSNVDAIPYRDGGQAFVYDTVLPGFGLRVGKKTKTYFAEKRVGGRTTRVTIGLHGHLTCEQARQTAPQHLGAMAGGRNPNQERRAAKASGLTLKEAIAIYLRLKKLKPHTLYDYKRLAAVALADWVDMPLCAITKDRVLELHARIGRDRGPAYANQAMRFFQAVYNLQLAKTEGLSSQAALSPNPVGVLSRSKVWFKSRRRQTVIKATELGEWLAAVLNLCPETATGTDRTVRDYLLLLALTGMRRSEAASLEWSGIDWKARTLTVPDTKNGDPHVLPLPIYLYGLLQKRRLFAPGRYVFPGKRRSGHLVEPRAYMATVTAICGVKFCLHDLRRTFASVAESLDLSGYTIQRLLNHRGSGGVTAGYVISDVERLRKAIQQIEDTYLAKLADHDAALRGAAAQA